MEKIELDIPTFKQIIINIVDICDLSLTNPSRSKDLNEITYNQINSMSTEDLSKVIILIKRHFMILYSKWISMPLNEKLFEKYVDSVFDDNESDTRKQEGYFIKSKIKWEEYETFAANYSQSSDITKRYNCLMGTDTPDGSYETVSHKMTDYFGLKEYYLNNKVFYAFVDLPKTLAYLKEVKDGERIKAMRIHINNATCHVSVPGAKHMAEGFSNEPKYHEELESKVKTFLDLYPEYAI